jgi:hypothetical protein
MSERQSRNGKGTNQTGLFLAIEQKGFFATDARKKGREGERGPVEEQGLP